MSIIVRALELGELRLALALIDQFNRPQARRLSDEEIGRIYTEITANGGQVLGADLDGDIVGTCTVNICANLSWAGRPYAIIENVIVDKQTRNQGVGKALMLHAQTVAEALGCYKVALMTGSKRASTLAFYESAGFVGNKSGFQRRFNA